MLDSGSEGLRSKVLEWAKEQGYSLEMRVAQTFKQAGFEVSQSRRYIDPESSEIREIDVAASVHRRIDKIDVSVTLYRMQVLHQKTMGNFYGPKKC